MTKVFSNEVSIIFKIKNQDTMHFGVKNPSFFNQVTVEVDFILIHLNL